MIEWLDSVDKSLFKLINGSDLWFLDDLMQLFSDKFIWIPLYLFLLYFLIRVKGSAFWISITYLILIFASTDQLSASIIKPMIERIRPCHFYTADQIRLIGHCGGKFGFVSAHAANTMGLASGVFFLIGKHPISRLIFIWAIAVGYSRVHLGVHYPGDVLGGFIIGISIALMWKLAMERIIPSQLQSPFFK